MSNCGVPAHGGPDAGGVPLHDFSTNANACGPCPDALAAVRFADPTHYPDPAYTALREELAAFHAVNPARIVLAGSASEFIARISLAVSSMGARAVRVPPHAYGDYARAARALGMLVRSGDGDDEDRETASSVDQRAAPGLIWACDPSSPLGRPEPDLHARVQALPLDRPMVLDRAYEPLRLSGRCALTDEQAQRVWQLWSPNKSLGMTGVRGAYAIAPRDEAQAELLHRLHRFAPSWPVGAHAHAMLQSWTQTATQQWITHSLHELRRWKAQQSALCVELGWRVLDSDSNYFCADWRAALSRDGLTSAEALRVLRERGVKLRDTASFGLQGRLGVRPPASQLALAQAMTLGRQRGR